MESSERILARLIALRQEMKELKLSDTSYRQQRDHTELEKSARTLRQDHWLIIKQELSSMLNHL